MYRRVSLVHHPSDQDVADRLAADLPPHLPDLHLDVLSIEPGGSLLDRLPDDFVGPAFLVSLLSADSVSEDWVTQDLDFAVHLDAFSAPLIPVHVRLDDSTVPEPLRAHATVDLRSTSADGPAIASLLTEITPDPNAELPSPVRWYCQVCGWACRQASNDYVCRRCGAFRVSPIGSATLVRCPACGHWELLVAAFCGSCGTRLRAVPDP